MTGMLKLDIALIIILVILLVKLVLEFLIASRRARIDYLIIIAVLITAYVGITIFS